MSSRVHIRRITLQAFRAFQERQSTSQLPTSGLVGIRGHNRDSKGSSGAGKSSVALAVAYAFGYLPFTATDQQNWHTKLPMQVELELDTPRGPAVLRRGKEFSLTVDGKLVKGSAKAVEDAIRELTGLPTNLLEALTYRQQQQRGRFLSMRDAEKKEFLGVLLGAGELEEQIAEAVKKGNKLQVEADQLKSSLEMATQFLQEPSPPIYVGTSAEATELAALAPKIEHAKKRLADAEEAQKALVAENMVELAKPRPPFVAPESKLPDLNAQASECNRRINARVDLLEAEQKRLRAEAAKKSDAASVLRSKAQSKAGIEAQVRKVQDEILKLRASKCPTCSREWEEAAAKLVAAEATLEFLSKEIAECDAANAAHAQLSKEANDLWDESSAVRYKDAMLDKLVEIRSQFERQIAEESARLLNAERVYNAERDAETQRINASFAERRQRARAAVDANQKAVDDLESRARLLQSHIDVVERSNDQLRQRHAVAVAAFAEQQVRVKQLRQQAEDRQCAANEELDYADSVRKYLGSLFDEVLEQISAETNELLRSIPNTPTTTVTFVSEVQTQKGTVKQEIKPVVIKNGQQVNLASGVSGGQLESVELAVDLSIAKVIGQRTGVRPGFMIFDESFAAHCLPVKEACLQVLSKAAEDCLILVVDHATELKEYFSSFVDVESENDVSRFVEAT